MKKLTNLFVFMLFISCGSAEDDTVDTTPQPQRYTLSVSAGSGGRVDSSGGTYEAGTQVTLLATPDEEYIFSGWSNGSSENPLTVIVNSNTSISASFTKKRYSLTVNVSGEGSVNEEVVTAGKTTNEYTSGSVIRLTAIPSNEEWEFLRWSGSVSSTSNPIEITLDETKNITATFDYEILSYAEQVCGLSLIEWSSHSLGYDTTFYFQVSDQDYVLTPDFQNSFIKSPKLLDKYVVLNGMGDSSGVSLNEVESICSEISVNQDLSINVNFSYDYNSSSLDPYLNIHSGIIDPSGSLREFQNLPDNFVGSTSDYFPVQIQDIDDNLVIEFNYEYLMFSDQNSSDVFLIDMFVFPERDGKWNKQKEIGIMLTRGDDYVNENEITLDNRRWYDEQITERYPHPLYSDEPDSYFNNKYYILKESQAEMLNDKMRIRLKPFIDDLIEKGFISPTEYLMFIETGIEVRAGRNQGGYLNISNYRILTD